MSGGGAARAPGSRPLIVIPAHDEQADIERVLRGIREHCEFPVVVVDDASSDRTAERARSAGATVLPLPLQLGAWGATQAGMRYALRHGYDSVMTMDADGQHEPVWIRRLMQPVRDGEAHVAIGCCTDRGSRLRRIAWRILKRVSGLSLEDITSGFRVYDRAAVELLASREATLLEYQDVGVLSLLHAADLNTVDLGVTMLPRRSGVSRVYHSWFAVTYYMCHTVLLGFSKRRLRARKPFVSPNDKEG
jgi:glycosyltransferase involved in cell wall biosynthesis